MSLIKLTLPDGTIKEVEKGITAKEVVEMLGMKTSQVMLLGANNHNYELGNKLNQDACLAFYDVNSQVGNKIYVKGLSYIFSLALRDLFGYEINYRIQTSVNNGLYVWFEEEIVEEEMINKLSLQMQSIIDNNHLFEKVTVDRLEAMEYFKKINRMEKVRLLRYNTKSYINLYRLRDQYDYYYGKLPYSSSDITEFDLKIIDERGLLLRFPTVFNNGGIPEFINQANLFAAYRDFSDWCSNQGITYAPDLNEYITFKDINELIRIEEGRHNNDLFEVCKNIKLSSREVKMVLIAGPTSSGKTTTSKKLANYLTGMGHDVKTISVDDYFKERSETPKDENGDYDYESMAAIDIKLFNEHLTALYNGEEICSPTYNFLTGVKEYKDKKMRLDKGGILIIEGLHALNDELTSSISPEEKYKIYISPLVQLNLDRNSPISSSDIRLLRRIVRDRKYRGNKVGDTIKAWPAIRHAEDKYIYKYQADADEILNTSLMYEIGVLKTLAEAYLYEVNEEQNEFEQVKMLLNFLRNFLPIPTEEIPRDSLLREFIGGSCYE